MKDVSASSFPESLILPPRAPRRLSSLALGGKMTDPGNEVDVSVALRRPCLCPSEGHRHSVSKQSSIILGGALLQITRGNDKEHRISY